VNINVITNPNRPPKSARAMIMKIHQHEGHKVYHHTTQANMDCFVVNDFDSVFWERFLNEEPDIFITATDGVILH
jgi:hypothetical protein